MKSFLSKSPEETFKFAKDLAQKAQPGEIYALLGDLGAGKTVFAKGFASGLGIRETVASPTFTLVCEYTSGRIPLYHFDVYRIEDPEEMFEIGLDEYLFGDGVCLIEWAWRIREELPDFTKVVSIERIEGVEDERRIEVCEKGERL